MRKSRVPFINLVMAVLFLFGAFAWSAPPSALAQSGEPLSNLGFELVNPDGTPQEWSVASVVDTVIVVDAEDSSEFSTYADMGDAAVSPYRGDLMLRLGTPKEISEKQGAGDNTAYQVFTSNGKNVKLAFRLFSWEFRGNDVVRIDLKSAGQPNGSPLGTVSFSDLDPSDGTVDVSSDSRLAPTGRSGADVLWEINIDLAKRNDYLDTGWIAAEISGLEDFAGTDLTLSYTVGGTGNSAHATWGYFDNYASAPVAKFHFEPDPALEGGRLKFIDDSFDIDGPDDIVSWEWTLYGPLERGTYLTIDGGERYLHDTRNNPWTAQNPSYILSDQGTYVAELTVTDSDGEASSVTSGGVASDGTPVPALVVGSTPPKVTALNAEVHEGEDLFLVGRFLDHGWLDRHTATWEVPGITEVPTILREDRSAFMSTGFVSGVINWETLRTILGSNPSFPVTINAQLRITETWGGDEVVTDPFEIKVFAAGNDSHEENSDSTANAPALPSDWIYSSYLDHQGDIDIFEITRPDGSSLSGGSEVLTSLVNLPADYDLVLLAQTPQDGSAADFDMSDFDMSDFDMSDFDMSDFDMSDFDMSDFDMSDFDMSDFDMSDFDMSDFDMSDFDMSDFDMSDFDMSGSAWANFDMSDFDMSDFDMSGSAWTNFDMSDFDMSDFDMSDFDMSDFDMSDFDMSDFDMSDFDMSSPSIIDFDMSEFDMNDFDMSDFDMSDFDMSDFDMSPLSMLSYTGLDGKGTTGVDISLTELGLGDILDDNTSVIGFSANRGPEDEVLLGHVVHNGMKIYAVVIGSNGVFSNEPYSLQVETSIPKPVSVSGTSLVPANQLTSNVELLHSQGDGQPLTLFVTQRQRMENLYGTSSWNSLLNELGRLADDANVDGDIISVPSDIYVPWDEEPSSIEKVNIVAIEIKTIIQDYIADNPGIEYIVLVGSDQIIPHRRVPDETNFNERFYALSSYTEWDSPLLHSMLGGYNLTDDYFVDQRPTAWQGRALYIPDTAIGRLVETPEEIIPIVDAFLASGGVLNAETALVTGYDFFDDGAAKTAENLGEALDTTLNISNNWDRDFLLNQFLGRISGVTPDVTSLNAHFTHYAALTAKGFLNEEGDILSTLDVADAGSDIDILLRKLVFTIGCHAGLNIPDESSQEYDPGLGIDPALDFAQVMAQQQAIYVASTGFGIGDDEGIGGTERLLTIFAENIVQDGTSLGKSLVDAKRFYLNSLSTMTVFDEKSSVQTTFYGLPMYRLFPSAPSATASASSSTGAQLSLEGYSLAKVATADGDYYTADGDAQSTAGRPIQPRLVIPLEGDGTDPVHGVVLTGGSYYDDSLSPNFDPVISRPTIEWETDATEPQIGRASFWPSQLATVNSLDIGDGLLQTLVVIPGQFHAEGSGAIVTGTQRLYDSLSYEILRASAGEADWQPPVVNAIDMRSQDDGSVAVTVHASDPSGIAKIVVLLISDGEIISTSSGELSGEGPYTVVVPGFADGDAIIVQVIDGAGNVATATGKGANMSVINVSGPDVTAVEDASVPIVATLEGFTNLVTPVYYVWYFGDGSSTTGITDNGIIEVSHVYTDDDPTGTPSDDYINRVKVTDSNGGIGTTEITVTVMDSAPVVEIESVTASPISEDDTVTLSGSFSDAGKLDTHEATIDWGDGSGPKPLEITQGAGGGTFAGTHQYLDDDPTGTVTDTYEITVTVTDDDTLPGDTTALIDINNLNPTVVAGSNQTVNEGDTISLDPAEFTDTGTLDTHTASVDWGEGNSSEGTVSESNGSGTVSGSHVYVDDSVNTLTVIVTDDDLGVGSDSLTVTVNNVPPTVVSTDVTGEVPLNAQANATADFTDPGILDTHTATWDWGDGNTSEGVVTETDGSGTVTGAHTYSTMGIYAVTLTVTDKDGGVAQSETQFVSVYLADPEGDASNPDADMVRGFITNDDTTMTITLRVAGEIANKIQYRIKLESNGSTTHLKYAQPKATGLEGLEVEITGNEISFTFDLSEIGAASGDDISLSFETQSGTPSSPGEGIPDNMPDDGSIIYVLQ